MSFVSIRLGLVLCLFILGGGSLLGQEPQPEPSRAQTQVTAVGILDFQDESGSNVGQLAQKVSQQLREKIIVSSQDLLPRLLGADTGTTAAAVKTPAELTDLGRQYGIKLVVRGGILPITVEEASGETKATVRLYADLVMVETGSIDTVRVEGSDAQAGSFPELSGLDIAAPDFPKTPVGQALARAIERLSELIHEKAIATVSAAAGETPGAVQAMPAETPAAEETASPTPVDAAAQAAEQDLELQQLIADAQSTLNAGLAVDQQVLNRVSQGLKDLQSSLAVKSDLLQRGEGTELVDQEIGQRKSDLRAAIDAVMQSQAVTDSAGYPVAQDSGQGGDFLASANNYASQAITLIQQIKELEAILGGANEEVQVENQEGYGEQSDEGYGQAGEQPMEEPIEEVTGVVVDDGQPVEGAEVTDTESGATTTTGPDGAYRFPIQPGVLSRVLVKRKGQQVAANRIRVVPGGMNVLDFPLTKFKGAGTGVMSSTTAGHAGLGNGGIIKGRLRDHEGKPASRVLVLLPGVGTVRSNSKGEFTFMNVPAGVHRLNVHRPGVEVQASEVQVSAKTVALAEVSLSRYTRQINAGLPIVSVGSGTAVHGRIRDDQNKALVAARVTVIRAGSSLSVRSGRDGAYELRNLSPGDYQIRVFKPGFGAAGTNISLAAKKREKRDFSLKQTSDLVSRIRQVEASKQGFMRGRIKGADNHVLAGASVEAVPVGRHLPPYRAKTGSSGEFKLTVREGQYQVRISQASFRSAARPVSVKAGKSVDADFTLARISVVTPGLVPAGSRSGSLSSTSQTRTTPPSRDSSVTSPGVSGSAGTLNRDAATKKPTGQTARPALLTGHVSGRVVDAKTGRPISGANVSISGSGSAATDGGGNYRISGIRPQSCTISVSRSGYQAQQRSVTIASGGSLTVNFSMTPVLSAPRTVIPRKPR